MFSGSRFENSFPGGGFHSETERIRKEQEIPGEEYIPSTEDEMPLEMKKEVTRIGLNIMRKVFANIPDYVVFASTAMSLYGLEDAPGDFDATVSSEQTLNRVRDHLARVPGVQFKHNGSYITSPLDGTKILKGSIVMEFPSTKPGDKSSKYAYPFEIFCKSTLVPTETFQKQHRVEGFNVLTQEGLQQQYANNTKMEERIQKYIDPIIDYLTHSEREHRILAELERWRAHQDSSFFFKPIVGDILDQFEILPEDLEKFYQIKQKKYGKISSADVAEILTGGLKIKLKKRRENIRKLID